MPCKNYHQINVCLNTITSLIRHLCFIPGALFSDIVTAIILPVNARGWSEVNQCQLQQYLRYSKCDRVRQEVVSLTDVKLWDVENGSTSQHLASLEFLENWISKISHRLRKKLGINMPKTGHPRDSSDA